MKIGEIGKTGVTGKIVEIGRIEATEEIGTIEAIGRIEAIETTEEVGTIRMGLKKTLKKILESECDLFYYMTFHIVHSYKSENVLQTLRIKK